MATITDNLGLPRPEANDNFNLVNFNVLIDAIDNKVAGKDNIDPVLNVLKSNIDANGIYTVVEWKRTDNTMYRKSTLSNADAEGNYQTQTIEFYDVDGTTLLKTQVWELTYDDNGNVSSETIQSEVLADATVG